MEEPEGRYRMPVSRWRRIAKIIVHKRGRPMKDPKATLEAIIDRYQGGYQWRKLPSEYGLHCNSVAPCPPAVVQATGIPDVVADTEEGHRLRRFADRRFLHESPS